MTHDVKHRLFVKLIELRVNNNRCINKILRPVRSSIQVQSQIPIGPAAHPMIDILLVNIGSLNWTSCASSSREANLLELCILHTIHRVQNYRAQHAPGAPDPNTIQFQIKTYRETLHLFRLKHLAEQPDRDTSARQYRTRTSMQTASAEIASVETMAKKAYDRQEP